jgi:hypothetical protein
MRYSGHQLLYATLQTSARTDMNCVNPRYHYAYVNNCQVAFPIGRGILEDQVWEAGRERNTSKDANRLFKK